MLKQAIVLLLLIFNLGCVSLIPHPRPWTNQEKLARNYFIIAHTANAFSTERHQDFPKDFYEMNPILGKHPSENRITEYFCVTGIITLIIADWYPELREPLLFGYGNINAALAVRDFDMVNER